MTKRSQLVGLTAGIAPAVFLVLAGFAQIIADALRAELPDFHEQPEHPRCVGGGWMN